MLISKKIFKNFPIYICMLLFLTFPIGIAITEFFLLILTIYFIYKNRSFEIFNNKIFFFLLIFSSYVAINSVIQISYFDFNLSSFFHFRFLIFSLSIFFILQNSQQDFYEKKILFKTILLFVGFIIVDSFIQFFYGKNIFGNKIVSNRISSIFFDELILGSFLIKILPFLLWLFSYSNFEFKKYKFFLIIFISLIFMIIYLSGERSAFILIFILSILIMYFIKDLRKIFIISLLILSLFITITSAFSIGKSNPFNRVFVKTYNQIFVQKNIEIVDDKSKIDKKLEIKSKETYLFSKDHQGHYILAYDLFLKSPIFGFGPEGFRSECRKINYDSKIGICSTHPHNILLQFLSELGLVGLSLYIVGFAYLLFRMLKLKKQNISLSLKNCFFLSSIGILVHLFPLLPSGSFFNNWISILLYYYIGLYLFSFDKCFSK
jgi:O-antigen ligase